MRPKHSQQQPALLPLSVPVKDGKQLTRGQVLVTVASAVPLGIVDLVAHDGTTTFFSLMVLGGVAYFSNDLVNFGNTALDALIPGRHAGEVVSITDRVIAAIRFRQLTPLLPSPKHQVPQPYVDGEVIRSGGDDEEQDDPDLGARDEESGPRPRTARPSVSEQDTFFDDDPVDLAFDGDIKTFRQLLEDGTIIKALKRGELCIGYVKGELRFIPIKDLFSMGIAGLSKTGKSTTTRFILFQFLLLGSRLVMIDPHITEIEESLAGQFVQFTHVHAMPPCGDAHTDVERRIKALNKEYLRRKEKGIKGPPIILVIDELNDLIRHLPKHLKQMLSDLLLTIEEAARKFGIYCILIGQRWMENDLGGKPLGASIRASLSAVIAHRLQSEEQASKLLGSRYRQQCLALATGHYLFRDTNGNTDEVYTPNTPSEDAILVQQILDQRRERASRSALPNREAAESTTVEAPPIPEKTLNHIKGMKEQGFVDEDIITVVGLRNNPVLYLKALVWLENHSEQRSERVPYLQIVPDASRTQANALDRRVDDDTQYVLNSESGHHFEREFGANNTDTFSTQNVSENVGNEPAEHTERVPNAFSPGPTDKVLSDVQVKLLVTYYRDCNDVKKALQRIRNEKGKGLGMGYYHHACWVLDSQGLRKRA